MKKLTGDEAALPRLSARPAIPPTCCRVPQMLPDTIATGDFMLFDAMGAYTVSSRSPFNGYYPDSWAILDD